jgi:Meckel syndrome type 1 protein
MGGGMPPSGGCGSSCGGDNGSGGTITIKPGSTPAPPPQDTTPQYTPPKYTPPQQNDPAPPPVVSQPLPPAEPWASGATEDPAPAAPPQNWVPATPPQDAPAPQLSLSSQAAPPSPAPQPVASTTPKCACVPPPPVVVGLVAAVALGLYAVYSYFTTKPKPNAMAPGTAGGQGWQAVKDAEANAPAPVASPSP